jgi:hypothetical protein
VPGGDDRSVSERGPAVQQRRADRDASPNCGSASRPDSRGATSTVDLSVHLVVGAVVECRRRAVVEAVVMLGVGIGFLRSGSWPGV